MKKLTILPAFIAGTAAMLLAVPAAVAITDDVVRATSDILADGERLDVQWNDGTLVLDGKVDPERVDQVVIEAAKLDGVKEIINKLYFD